MQVIPVLDLMSGQVVRGIAGRRSEYRPIQTPLADSADPVAIGRAFKRKFGLSTLYVADLDAIAGAEPDWTAYERLLAAGLQLWVDAGVADVTRGRQLAEFRVAGRRLARVIIGLETTSPAALREAAGAIGPERCVFSLDLKAGMPLVQAGWQGASESSDENRASESSSAAPLEIALAAHGCGIRQLIVLDLARVGVNQGAGTDELCRQIKARHADMAIIAGGGVRNMADLDSLAAAGCSAALVASALHDGRLSPAQVASLSQTR
jgi:phosphoribosylformimino-5-aminoimidazole carboxamide ribotide isomerase